MEKVLGVNLVGPFLGTKHAARVMNPACRVCIISTSSTAAVSTGLASHGYTCSKHAVVWLTKNTAFELGRFGIRVSYVSSLDISTPLATQFPNLRDEQFENVIASSTNLKGIIHKKDDIASAVLYLASDDAKYVSGRNLVVDGGFSLGNPRIHVFQEF